MSCKLLFVDRDGSLIEEPADGQIDTFEKLTLLPNVIPALRRCVSAGYQLIMVTNQDGLGTASFPEADFQGPHQFLLRLLNSQGVSFREVLIDRSFPHEQNGNRKPRTGLVRHYLRDDSWSRTASAMIGDRDSDMVFAENLGVRGLRVGREGIDWLEVAHVLCDLPRTATVSRDTRETQIRVTVDLDAANDPEIRTGIGYFDHMLEQISKHGGFSLALDCDGDLCVDEHHTVEDSALALGQALRQALGDKRGISRYGFTLPMDEALASAALDLSGRPWFEFEGTFPRDRVGEFSTEMVPHFFRSLCDALGATLHLKVSGENTHHMVEGCFKAMGRVLRQATHRDGVVLPSTKGTLQ